MKNNSRTTPPYSNGISIIELVCHPATPSSVPFKLEVQWAARQFKGDWALQMTYHVIGDVQRLRLARPTESNAADGLWAHTCFEAFFSEPCASAYREFNFSPSTQWAHYRFTSERKRDPLAAGLKVLAVQAPIAHADRLVMTACVAASPSIQGLPDTLFSPTAVLELDDGSLSYWAVSHHAQKPDFHAQAGWTIPLRWTIN